MKKINDHKKILAKHWKKSNVTIKIERIEGKDDLRKTILSQRHERMCSLQCCLSQFV